MQKTFLASLTYGLVLSCQVLLGGTLAKEGKTSHVIVLAKDAIEAEKTAARELQTYLRQVTGAEFPICCSTEVKADSPKIWVGASEAVQKRLPQVDWRRLPADAIVLESVENDLILAGGRPRGALYAVYTFLEDVVGVRWWTSTEQFVPKKPTLEIPSLKVHYQPQFRYREAFYRDALFDRETFTARLKLNGHHAATSPAFGGHYSILGFCHTFEQLLPSGVYFKDHPEWYSLINGKRTAERAQLCLTNDAMRKELTRVALGWIKKNPTAGILSISQNDCNGACECERCKAIKDREGSESGPLIHFVNAVAKDVAKAYPDFLIHTLAYTYTEAPPRYVKPEPNVMVQLCSMGSYFDFPLADQRFGSNLAQWSKLTSNLFIWDYVTNFSNYHLPHPNLRMLGPNIRLFAKDKVAGIFEQGDTGSLCGDFVQLRAWLLAHLLWDPSLDEKKLVQEFVHGYYGAAAPAIASYLDLVHDAFASRKYHLGCYNNETAFLSLEQMNQATRLFGDAEKAVQGDPTLLARVQRERISLDYLWLLRCAWLKRQAELTHATFLGPVDPVAACDALAAKIRKYDQSQGQYAEGKPFDAYVAELKQQAKAGVQPAAHKTPSECVGLDPIKWIELQENQFSILSGDIHVDDDPAASNGKAIGISGSIFDWFVRASVTGDVALAFPKAQCLISARCEAISKNPDELALSIGLYNESDGANAFVKTLHVKDFKPGEYKTFDLGTYSLKGNCYFWIASSGKGDKIRKVHVDRMILIRKD